MVPPSQYNMYLFTFIVFIQRKICPNANLQMGTDCTFSYFQRYIFPWIVLFSFISSNSTLYWKFFPAYINKQIPPILKTKTVLSYFHSQLAVSLCFSTFINKNFWIVSPKNILHQFSISYSLTLCVSPIFFYQSSIKYIAL